MAPLDESPLASQKRGLEEERRVDPDTLSARTLRELQECHRERYSTLEIAEYWRARCIPLQGLPRAAGEACIAARKAPIFASLTSWEHIGELALGQILVTGGPVKVVSGYVMLPLQAGGAVDLAAMEPPWELRVDPCDRLARTFSQLRSSTLGKYRDEEIRQYWNTKCEPLEAVLSRATGCSMKMAAPVFASTASWHKLGVLPLGHAVTLSGPPHAVEGYVMVPIEPVGAVDFAALDLELPEVEKAAARSLRSVAHTVASYRPAPWVNRGFYPTATSKLAAATLALGMANLQHAGDAASGTAGRQAQKVIAQMQKALDTGDIRTLSGLLPSAQEVPAMRETVHPWIESPTTIGALVGIHLALLAENASKHPDSNDARPKMAAAGAVRHFVDFLKSPCENRQQIAVVALGFLTAGCPLCCEIAFKANAVEPLVAQMSSPTASHRAAAASALRSIWATRGDYHKAVAAAGGISALVFHLKSCAEPNFQDADLQLEAVLNLLDAIEGQDGRLVAEYARLVNKAGAQMALESFLEPGADADVRDVAQEALAALKAVVA